MMNLLMLRGMIASTYRPIVLPYRWFDLRRCDLRHRLAHFSARLIGWGQRWQRSPKAGAEVNGSRSLARSPRSRGSKTPVQKMTLLAQCHSGLQFLNYRLHRRISGATDGLYEADNCRIS